jgi:hypothetical protein
MAIAVLMHGCSARTDDSPVGVVSAALSACDETVPANRNVDGIPAYAQCTASQNSAIYSNNGVDTSLTQMGADWVRTQYSGGYQCTEFAHRYFYFKWQVKWVPNGNAGTWCDTMPPATSGLVQTMTPVHGDAMVLAPGSCGADKVAGHVNVIDVVGASGSLTAVEQNGARRGTYMQSCAKCFLHVVANDGTAAGAAGSPGTADAAPGAGGSVGGVAGAPAPSGGPGPRAGAPAPAPVPAPAPAASTPAPASPAAPAPTPAAPVASSPVVGAAGSAAVPSGLSFMVAPRDANSASSGCSAVHVGHAGRAGHATPTPGPAWLALTAIAALCARRRTRRA